VSKRAEIHIRNLVLPAMLMVSIGASAETLTGTVVGVADGDTITVLDANREQHKIRLAGIDAPEKAQPFGQRSKENLSRLVFDKDVGSSGRSETSTSASSARCGCSPSVARPAPRRLMRALPN
jgi:endonuclease YncB( thermonuclease family)